MKTHLKKRKPKIKSRTFYFWTNLAIIALIKSNVKITPAIWLVNLGAEQKDAVISFTGILIVDILSNIPAMIAVAAIDSAEIIVAL